MKLESEISRSVSIEFSEKSLQNLKKRILRNKKKQEKKLLSKYLKQGKLKTCLTKLRSKTQKQQKGF